MNMPFNEDHWPCAVFFREEYERRLAEGRVRIAQKRVAIGGLARDLGATLPATIAQLEQTGALFADYAVVVYENDSDDDTLAQLKAWSERNPRVTILSETLENPRWSSVKDPRRTRDLAYYRSQVQGRISRDFRHFDAALIVDLDLSGWSADGLAHTFGADDWDAVGSNGISLFHNRAMYLDGWALRALGHPGTHPSTHVNSAVLPRGAPLQPVLSCFGGLALYAMPAFAAGRYDGSDCEHVTFHESLRQAGFPRIFLNPSQIVRYPAYEVIEPLAMVPGWLGEEAAPKQATVITSTGEFHPTAYKRIFETPAIPIRQDANTELHMLVCEGDVQRAFWSIKSFYRYAKLRIGLAIHDDGSLSPSSKARFAEHFPGCRLYTGHDAAILQRLEGFPLCQYFRKNHFMARKLIDVLLTAQTNYVLGTDSDVLWFRASPVVTSCIRERKPFYQDGGAEAYVRNRKFMEDDLDLHPAPDCNAGVVGYPVADFRDFAFLETALERLINVPAHRASMSIGFRNKHVKPESTDWNEKLCWWVMEQTLYALLFGRATAVERLNNWPGHGVAHQFPGAPLTANTALVHYISDSFHKAFFEVGVEHLLGRGFLAPNEAP